MEKEKEGIILAAITNKIYEDHTDIDISELAVIVHSAIKEYKKYVQRENL